MIKQSYKALGLMSGTSLDGLDLALVQFEKQGDWQFKLLASTTRPYSQDWQQALKGAPSLAADQLLILHQEFGRFLGKAALDFLKESGHSAESVDLLASHGHTVFHQPRQGMTFQLGAGSSLRASSDLPVVCDFRSADVALGGQGAPLVPIGDRLLFPDYEACINLGGFSNISYEDGGQRRAYDIGPCNGLLNYLAEKLGEPYDLNGQWAREGQVNADLLNKLNQLDYYAQVPPKSLGREWLEETVLPAFLDLDPKDGLATATEHIARLLADNLPQAKAKILLTGGGAHNAFLLQRLRSLAPAAHWVVPEQSLIDFKEALVFAFLGLLRLREENNVLASVTGATHDHCSGHLLP